MLEHGRTDRRAYREIVNGTPLIHVTVQREEDGGIFIDVRIIGR